MRRARKPVSMVHMELGVVVAARDMAERRRDEAVGLHPGAPTALRLPAAGLKELRLHPVERRPDRRVMGAQHRLVAVEQRLQRHRLRRAEGRVPPRAVLVLALHDAAQPDRGSRNMARENLHEPALAHPLRQAQSRRAPAVPAVRRAVFGIVARQVFVEEVAERLFRGGKRRRARKHVATACSVRADRAAGQRDLAWIRATRHANATGI